MTTKQQYEEMFVTVPSHALDDPNHETALEDMTGYIQRMGGTVGEWCEFLPGEASKVRYSWSVPAHWTGRLYERFLSFGLKARVRPDSWWFGLLGEK